MIYILRVYWTPKEHSFDQKNNSSTAITFSNKIEHVTFQNYVFINYFSSVNVFSFCIFFSKLVILNAQLKRKNGLNAEGKRGYSIVVEGLESPAKR